MVPPSKKRKLPSSTGPTPTPKRTKKAAKATKSQPKKTSKDAPARRAVDANALAWKTVGEEEFGGLQVIEGVDVVKHGDRVQFLVAENQTGANEAGDNEDNDDDESGSFEGFGDDPVEGGHLAASQDGSGEVGLESSGPQGKAESKNDRKKKDKKTADKPGMGLGLGNGEAEAQDDKLAKASKDVSKSASRGNSFNALAAIQDTEEEDDVDMGPWVELNLSPRILSAIAKLKFANPTAIQRKAIPEIIAGEDVIGKAQTGSGKTLAFGIPMVERWLELYEGREDEKKAGPLAVVLSPTRELAKQLGDHMKALCDGLPTAPYICVVTGGLSIQKQQRQLEKADIVIGTPGRLWEVLSGDIKLQDSFSKIKFLVVDEADRLFKVGQFKEAEDIIGALDKRNPEADSDDSDDEEEDKNLSAPRQTLVFSATFDKNLQTKLAGKGKFTAGSDEEKMEYLMKCLKFRREPKFIDVNPVSSMATGLKEGLIECGAMEKVCAY